jgi:phosphinothricin acetyltransferase
VGAPRIRRAEQRDLPELTRIYNHYVTTTHVTFDTHPFTVDQRRSWFESFSGSGAHQLLVAEIAGRSVGYASTQELRAKPAYDRSVESTIYLDPAFVGRGFGQQLYGAVLDRMRAEKDVHRAYGGIALPNAGSIALHERFGFELVGTFHEAGFKFGKYWDVSWYEKDVSDPDAA